MTVVNRTIIIDYGLGNLFSVKHALLHFNIDAIITSDKNKINTAEMLILPGVGAFGDAMNQLKKLDLITPILDFVQSGKLFMGICLGMQLLFEQSEEFGNHKGLGLLDGNVYKFPQRNKSKIIRIPHIGWNTIYPPRNRVWTNTMLNDIKQNAYMYFVHSYYAKPEIQDDILSLTNYEDFEYCSSINRKNIYGFQFHPEKSGKEGLKIYSTISKQFIIGYKNG